MAASDHPAVVPPRLFVYGTLQPGRLRWPVLAPFATGHRPASVPGTLHDTGNGWPVAVFEPGDGDVPGVLVDLDPAAGSTSPSPCSTASRAPSPACSFGSSSRPPTG